MDRISESHEAAGNRAGVAIEASLNYLEPTSRNPSTTRTSRRQERRDRLENLSRTACRFETRAKWSATCRSTSRVSS